MKCLIVEDDFGSRKLIQRYLQEHGECDAAVNGEEAIDAFYKALMDKEPYDLICLDIMMPITNGHETLTAIRQIESNNGIHGLDGVKIIMMTALDDSKNIFGAFREGCEAYIVKPIERYKLISEMVNLGLINSKCFQS